MSQSSSIENSSLDVQALSMQWLDFQYTGRFIGWDEATMQTKSLKEIAQKVVLTYNTIVYKSTEQSDKSPFVPHPCEFSHPEYELSAYVKPYSFSTRLNKRMNQEGKKRLKRKGNESLLFFCKEKPTRTVVILTSDQAWRVVRRCVNHANALKVAEVILDPHKIIQITRRCLVGPHLQETLVNPARSELFKTSSLYYLVESFECSIKRDSSLTNIPPFSRQKKNTSPAVRISMCGLLRIVKKISLEDYPRIFDQFSSYISEQPTYSTVGALEKRDPQFEFLHFIQPAQANPIELNRSLINMIWSAYQNQEPQLVSFRHKYVYDFLSSTEFFIQLQPGKRFQHLSSSPPSLEDILDAIHEDQDELNVDVLEKILGEGQLRYVHATSGQKVECHLIDCLEAEIRYDERSYFKIKGLWYQLTADFNALLIEDYRRLLKQKMIDPSGPGQLPNPWIGNTSPGKINEDNAGKALVNSKGVRKILNDLDEAKMCYINKAGSVQQKRLIGSITEAACISNNLEAIQKELASDSAAPFYDRLKALFPDQVDEMMGELQKERPILRTVKSGKRVTSRTVLNPATYPIRDLLGQREEAFAAFLEKMYTIQRTEDEGGYNRNYLYDRMNQGKFYEPQAGYLVFDKVTPNNIELCDIVHYSQKTTWLYQVKEDFNHKTREACSQILNAAKVLRAALSTHQPKHYLQMFWEEVMQKNEGWQQLLKEQLKSLGKQNFFKIFTERKIVFVYAFLEMKGRSLHSERKIPTRLSANHVGSSHHFKMLKQKEFLDPHCRLTGKFYESSQDKFSQEGFGDASQGIYKKLMPFKPVSDSTLAKLELIHLARELEALQFEFKICEIKRANPSEETAVELSQPASPPLFEGSSISEDEDKTEVIPEAPSGLKNVGNSCYMNACLQALYYLEPIRDQINAQKKESKIAAQLAVTLEQREPDNLTRLRNLVFKNKDESTLQGPIHAQHDAHEFLIFLLNQIDWFPMKTYTRFFYTLPDGIGKKSHKASSQLCNHILLDIDPALNLQQMLTRYFKKQNLHHKLEPSYNNKIYTVTDYSRAERIKHLPSILIIGLKRFKPNDKINTPIALPVNHQLTIKQRHKDPETTFSIVAIVNHHGNRMHDGHYTANIKDIEQGRWLHCDDEQVTLADPHTFGKDAYLIFLKKEEE